VSSEQPFPHAKPCHLRGTGVSEDDKELRVKRLPLVCHPRNEKKSRASLPLEPRSPMARHQTVRSGCQITASKSKTNDEKPYCHQEQSHKQLRNEIYLIWQIGNFFI